MKTSTQRSGKQVTLHQLLALVPDTTLERLAKQTQVDHWVHKLKGPLMFKLLLYGLLQEPKLSLRALEHRFHTFSFQTLVGLLGERTRHSSIADRLSKMNPLYFQKLYEHFYEAFAERFDAPLLEPYTIKRYDSTMIAVSAKLCQGMRVGTNPDKKQLKYTTLFRNKCLLSIKAFRHQDYLSEEAALKDVIESDTHEQHEIVVFDGGLKSRPTLKKFDDTGTRFVTRMREDTRFDEHEAAGELPEDGELQWRRDSWVTLYESGNKRFDHRFRLIEAYDPKNEKKLIFVTNIEQLPADTIATFYRRRYDIEVLFRFLKQELNLKHLLGMNPNAIANMIYMSLITAMLILVYKQQNQVKGYREVVRQMVRELEKELLLGFAQLPDFKERVARLSIRSPDHHT